MNNPNNYTSSTIDNLLNGISEKDQERTNYRMKLAAKIADALDKKGWSKGQLAEAMDKQPSIITKWLSGTHNFTSDTLWEIEGILDVNLLNLDEEKQVSVVTQIHITREAEVFCGYGLLGDTAFKSNYSSYSFSEATA